MADGLVPPVVPGGGATAGNLADARHAVQVPVLPTAAAMVYGMGRVDTSGRVSGRSVVRAMGWSPGDPLAYRVLSRAVVVRRDPGSAFGMTCKSYVVLPAAVRTRCRIRPGDQVLLARAPQQDLLVVHTLASVDRLLSEYHAALLGGEKS